MNNKAVEELQSDVLLISDCKLAVSSADLIAWRSLVSSAYLNGVADWKKSDKSLMKTTNSRGPRTLPWAHLNVHNIVLKMNLLFLQVGSNFVSMLQTISLFSQLFRRLVVCQVNNRINIYTTSTSHLLGWKSLSAKTNNCWRVDLFGRKPNWCLVDCSLTQLIILLYTILSFSHLAHFIYHVNAIVYFHGGDRLWNGRVCALYGGVSCVASVK